MAETTPITPVDLLDAQRPLGDASLQRSGGAPLTPFEERLRSPWRFWPAQIVLFTPLALFLLQGLLNELGLLAASARINDFLFTGRHTIVGDLLGPVILPACAMIIALARMRVAKRGLDRTANIALIWLGLLGVGIVLAYALLENVGKLLR
jgi:hypothetical protein